MARRDTAPTAAQEETCRRAADLIQRLPTAPEAVGWEPEWEPLRRALSGARRGDRPRRWRRLWIAPVAAVALLAAIIVMRKDRPLGYRVEGASVSSSGRMETAPAQTASFKFSDGTSIALAGESAGRVVERSPDGATFRLERGRASFDVVHRGGSHWRVMAGPFEILVTGTRFDLDWSETLRNSLEIDLRVGAVTVRRGPSGEGVALHAGQHVSAKLDGDTLAMVPIKESAERAAAAPPPATSTAINGGPGALSHTKIGGHLAQAPKVPRTTRASDDESERRPPSAPPSEPAPSPRSSPPPTSGLAAGGAACWDWAPQFRFDQSIEGAFASSMSSLALSHAALDQTRSWCGAGSLRADADFDVTGPPNLVHMRPRDWGSVIVKFAEPVDFTGKTLSAHIYVDAPADVRFDAEVFAIDGPLLPGTWVGGGRVQNIAPGHWLTLSHTYEKENPVRDAGGFQVSRVSHLAVQIYSVDHRKIWRGKVFVDDVGWR